MMLLRKSLGHKAAIAWTKVHSQWLRKTCLELNGPLHQYNYCKVKDLSALPPPPTRELA